MKEFTNLYSIFLLRCEPQLLLLVLQLADIRQLIANNYWAGELSLPLMTDSGRTRAEFINLILTSQFPGQVAKRFAFADGEVAALYTLGRPANTRQTQPVVLFVATFPPDLTQAGFHNFGIDYFEQPVASADEAQELLDQFDQTQATLFRTKCRPPLA